MSDTNGRQYSDEDILDAIRDVAEDTGEPLSISTYNEQEGVPASSVVIDRFGSWVQAKKKAGVGGDGRANNARPRKYSTAEMIQMLRECNDRHGRASQSVFDADDEFCSSGAIVKRFGSWGQAKKEAGLDSYDPRDASSVEVSA